MTSNYRDEVPENVDKTQEEWENLSYHAQYYYLNEERQENIRRRQKERRHSKKAFLEAEKKQRGCYFCGLDESCCLDWHHVEPENKEKNLSRMAASDYSKESMRKEMEKCIVICANCHRKLHEGIIEI